MCVYFDCTCANETDRFLQPSTHATRAYVQGEHGRRQRYTNKRAGIYAQKWLRGQQLTSNHGRYVADGGLVAARFTAPTRRRFRCACVWMFTRALACVVLIITPGVEGQLKSHDRSDKKIDVLPAAKGTSRQKWCAGCCCCCCCGR